MRSRYVLLSAFFALALVISVTLQQALVRAGSDLSAPLVPFQPSQRGLESHRLEHIARSIPSTPTDLATLRINPQTLVSHVTALSYPRWRDADRDQARQYIQRTLQAFHWRVDGQSYIHSPTGSRGVNLVAERSGTQPSAGVLLLGAHYDTVPNSPGADDNATGVAVMLEVARLLGSVPTPLTLRLAFFDQEELGLWGSLDFVAQPANVQNLRGAVIMDMVGYACYQAGCQSFPAGLGQAMPTTTGDFLAVIGNQENQNLIHAFLPASQGQIIPVRGVLRPRYQPRQGIFPAIMAVAVPLRGVLTPDLLRSDHGPFWQQKIGAVLLTDTANFRSPFYHQATDTPTQINRDFFVRSAQLILNATATLLQNA